MSEPSSIDALWAKAQSLTGVSLYSLATRYELHIPSLAKHKGWIGQLLELALGATAGNAPIADFPSLGIELKTIPMTASGKVLETTYLCKAPTPFREFDFYESRAYRKLKHVLWVPILSAPNLNARRIGPPRLFYLKGELLKTFEDDWLLLADALRFGDRSLNGSWGTYLHIRPKAASSRDKVPLLDQDENFTRWGPKGFYLRTQFTQQLFTPQGPDAELFSSCVRS